MNNNTHIKHNRSMQRRAYSLAMAVVIGIGGIAGSAAVSAQSTAGSVFGNAPAGQTITAKSTTTGLSRHVVADAKGRYTIGALPVGVYTVTLAKDGAAVLKHTNVQLTVGRGIKVDFPCAQDQCAAAGNQ